MDLLSRTACVVVGQLRSHNQRRKTVIRRLSLSRLGGVYFIDDGPAGHGNIFRAFVSARYIGKSLSFALFLSLARSFSLSHYRSFFLSDNSRTPFRLARIAVAFVKRVREILEFQVTNAWLENKPVILSNHRRDI